MACALSDHTVSIFDMRVPHEPVNSFSAHSESIADLILLSPQALLTAGNEGSIRMWDMRAANVLCLGDTVSSHQKNHGQSVSKLAFINTEYFASCGFDGFVKFYQINFCI